MIQKVDSPAGNRTPVSRVTGGDTDHYTTEDCDTVTPTLPYTSKSEDAYSLLRSPSLGLQDLAIRSLRPNTLYYRRGILLAPPNTPQYAPRHAPQ
jgi:hypothetical protein